MKIRVAEAARGFFLRGFLAKMAPVTVWDINPALVSSIDAGDWHERLTTFSPLDSLGLTIPHFRVSVHAGEHREAGCLPIEGAMPTGTAPLIPAEVPPPEQ